MSDWNKAVEKAHERERDPRSTAVSEEAPLLTDTAQAPF